MRLKVCTKLILLFISVVYCSVANAANIMGWLENIYIMPGKHKLIAKLDTGAKTSSIDAINIRELIRNDEEWVVFTIPKTKYSSEITLEKKLVRTVLIKQRVEAKASKKASRRMVVSLTICLGGKTEEIEFSLSDRERFNYPMLLGRAAIEKLGGAIDPTITFSQKLQCQTKANK